MKEITKFDPIYLEEYDIHVNQYLTPAQIQQIIGAMSKFDVWAEREENKNILILYHATDMGKENIEKYDYEELLCSGLIDAVIKNIKNYNQVDEAMEWSTSLSRAFKSAMKDVGPMLKGLGSKHADSTK